MPARPTSEPDPPLTDGVVTLRCWTLDDVPAIAAACTDPEIARWIDSIPQPYTEASARGYVAHADRGWSGRGGESPFAVVDAESGDVLGSCGVHWIDAEHGIAEVGYWVRREARGPII